MEKRGSFNVGISLLAAATLAFEVYLTRVYSLMIWPYMAFVVVSVAMLGVGAAGAWLATRRASHTTGSQAQMATCAWGFGAVALIGTAIVGHFPADLGGSLISLGAHVPVVLYYLVSGAPFFLSGYAFALAFRSFPEQAHRIYFYDLMGAAVGALAVLGAMNLVGGGGTLATIAIAAAAASACFSGFKPDRLTLAGVLAAAALLIAIALPGAFRVELSPQKFLPFIQQATGASVERSYWNALGRVDVIAASNESKASLGAFEGLSRSFRGGIPEVKWISIDGGAETPILRFDGDLDELDFADHYLPALAAQAITPKAVLIIGAGGGIDVLAALANGATRVDAVELNPAIIDIGITDYADFNGGLFLRPDVSFYGAEGRSFVRGSDRAYDLILLSLVDTFTAAASGAHALSENYIYTVEAFRDYYRHLNPGGAVTVTRNYFTFAHESLRLATLIYEAWKAEGEPHPEDCIAVFTNERQANVIARRGGLNEADVAHFKTLAAGKYRVLWLPGNPMPADAFARIYRNHFGGARLFLGRSALPPAEAASLDREAASHGYQPLYSSGFMGDVNEFAAYFAAEDKDEFYRKYFYDIEPTTDDRPFYFLTSKWRNLYISPLVVAPDEFIKDTNFVVVPHAAQFFLLCALAEAALLSILFILAPVYFFRKRGLPYQHKGAFGLYFVLLGVGFMLIEIPLIQKFTLYLGHPVYAFATGLAALLAASAVGSLASVRFRDKRWVPFAAIVILAIVIPLTTDPLLAATLGWPLVIRVAIVIAALAPLGFFLGMPFPLGIDVATRTQKELIPWAWAANGCASVVGPAAAVLMAATTGHNFVIFIAAALYALALMAILRMSEGHSSDAIA